VWGVAWRDTDDKHTMRVTLSPPHPQPPHTHANGPNRAKTFIIHHDNHILQHTLVEPRSRPLPVVLRLLEIEILLQLVPLQALVARQRVGPRPRVRGPDAVAVLCFGWVGGWVGGWDGGSESGGEEGRWILDGRGHLH
jgi:hypothetical protein